jgi:hypothetical protein
MPAAAHTPAGRSHGKVTLTVGTHEVRTEKMLTDRAKKKLDKERGFNFLTCTWAP